MVDQEQQKSRADLIPKLFAQLTGRFEVAATLAAKCPGPRSNETLTEGAALLPEIAQTTMTITEPTLEILGGLVAKAH